MAFLRALGRLAYVFLLCVVFGLSAWVSFRYFLQGKSVAVPDLSGREVEEARRLLADKGLDLALEPDLAQYDEVVPPDRIRVQAPRAGTPVKSGATIRVSLSLGPRILSVPDLAGQTSRTALLALDRLGLVLGTVTNLTVPGASGVVGQEPPPGERIGPGEKVSILVARDPGPVRRILPDFVGDDLEKATAQLTAFGYRIGSIREEAYEGVPAGRILRQYPLAGYPAPAGFAVSFVVCQGAGGGN